MLRLGGDIPSKSKSPPVMQCESDSAANAGTARNSQSSESSSLGSSSDDDDEGQPQIISTSFARKTVFTSTPLTAERKTSTISSDKSEPEEDVPEEEP